MRLRLHFPLFFIFVSAGLAFGQNPYRTISGTVTDAATGEPVPFANIFLKSGSSGTATNTNGEFVFKIPTEDKSDSLVVSSIGYERTAIVLATASDQITVRLVPAIVQLNDVLVQANKQTGLDFLQEVLERIPQNYDTSATQLIAFYREKIQLGDRELAHTEAVVDIYKQFRTEKHLNDHIRIIKGRKKKIDFGRDGQFLYWMSSISNGVRGVLANDLVKYRNGKFCPFNPKSYGNYDYVISGMMKEGGSNLIIMNILPKPRRRALLNLKLYIDEASLAIVRYDLSLSERGVQYVERKDNGFAYFLMSKIVGASRDYHSFNESYTFKEYNGKQYLYTVRRNWEILVSSRKRDMVNERWTADMEFVVTDTNTEGARPITEGNIGSNEGSIGSLVEDVTDESFWEDYNYLKPISQDSLVSWTDTATQENVPRATTMPRKTTFTRADSLRGKLTPVRSCYDVTFYHLDVAVNFEERAIEGSNRIRFHLLQPAKRIQLDLYANITIDSILYNDQQLNYTREFDAVFVDFPRELRQGSNEEIQVFYHGIPQTPDFSKPMNGGVLWEKDSLGNDWVQVVCQGSGASLWWPNKDHLSDEPDSMKIWITVPAPYHAVSNGRLERWRPVADSRTRYEWSVTYPINNYNATFTIGKYHHFSDVFVTTDTLTIDYYVMPYNLDRAKKVFTHVKTMLQVYEMNFGKYPFPRDGFTLVESPYPMEHQSSVCIGRITAQNANELNPLLWHEAAHEWWGNAISCSDMADLWIHEAFATYAEVLVVEALYDKATATTFANDNRGQVRNVDPVIGAYEVNDIFYEIGDMYSKGALMLHTLRNVIDNDSVWVSLLLGIQDHFRYKTLNTNELNDFINTSLKGDFTPFFDQYLRHTAIPVLEIKFVETANELEVSFRWKANIDSFTMPIRVTTSPDRYDFIYPTREWKKINLRNMSPADFDVDEANFFVEVDYQY